MWTSVSPCRRRQRALHTKVRAAGPHHSLPDCLLIVYRCTNTCSLTVCSQCTGVPIRTRRPPWPDHASPDCLLEVCLCTRTHSPYPPPWPGHWSPDCSFIVYRCTRTQSLHPPPSRGHSSPFQLNLPVCKRCTGVCVHTRRVLLPGLATRSLSSA
jgi:hypothetical protein